MRSNLKILFNGKEHETAFYSLMSLLKIPWSDSDRRSLVYILTITEDCRNNFFDCYDKDKKCIKCNALQHDWVTRADAKAIRLAFNLYGSNIPTGLIASDDKRDNLYNYYGEFEYNMQEVIRSLPSAIFGDYKIGKYLLEGIRMCYIFLFD